MPKVVWELSIRLNEIDVSFGNKIDLCSLINVFSGKEVSYRTEVIKNYFYNLFGPTNINISYFNIKYPVIIASLIIFIILIFLKIRKEKPRNYIYVLIVFAEIVIYSSGLLIIYMYKFSEYEAKGIASFSRYYGILLNMLWFFAFFSFTSSLENGNDFYNSIQTIIVSVIVILAIDWAFVQGMFDKQLALYSIELRNHYEDFCDDVKMKTEDDSRIFYISQGDSGFNFWISRFILMPRIVDNYYEWNIGGPKYEGDIWNCNIPLEEWQEQLKNNYDYVAIFDADDELKEKYADVFNNPENISDGQVFLVDENGKLTICN